MTRAALASSLRLALALALAVATSGCASPTETHDPSDLLVAPPDLASPAECDTLKQDCPSDRRKCSFLDDGMGGVRAACVDVTCIRREGEPCVRPSEMPSGVGRDDCARGLYCSGVGQLSEPPSRRCRAFCGDDAGCRAGSACAEIALGAVAGFCVPTCTPLAPGCGQGLDCSHVLFKLGRQGVMFACRATGKVAPGAACAGPLDCTAGHVCNDAGGGTRTCTPLCDDTRPCPGGGKCMKQPGHPGGTGLCG